MVPAATRSKGKGKNFSRPASSPKPQSQPNTPSAQEDQDDAIDSAVPGQAFSFPWESTPSADGVFVFGTDPESAQPEAQTEMQQFRFDSVNVEKEESLSSHPSDRDIATTMERDDVAMEIQHYGPPQLEAQIEAQKPRFDSVDTQKDETLSSLPTAPNPPTTTEREDVAMETLDQGEGSDVQKDETSSSYSRDPGTPTMVERDDVDMLDPDEGDIEDNGHAEEDVPHIENLEDVDMTAPDRGLDDDEKVEAGAVGRAIDMWNSWVMGQG